MNILGINGWEFILLAVLGVFILGPDRLPEYAAKLAQWVHKARVMADGAKGQLKEQLGPDYEDINWRQYDPRQYDPRRIVREALAEPIAGSPDAAMVDDHVAPAEPPASPAGKPMSQWDPTRPVPYDNDAT